MPVFEPEAKPVKKVVFSARVDPSIVETLRAYCDFLNSSSQHHVMRTVAKSRVAASAVVAVVTWAFGHFHTPFPAANDLIVLVANAAPHVVAVVRLAYTVMWFTSRSSSAPSCCRSATYSW